VSNESQKDNEHLREDFVPDVSDAIRQILAVRQLSVPSYATPVVGTSEQEEKQMREYDETQLAHPTEIVKDGYVQAPNWKEAYRGLPANPAIYETRYVLDQYFRFDTQFVAAGTTAVITLPNAIPNGKFGFLDEIHIAQLSGVGSSPNGFLTDIQQSQLYAIVTPDGSTFGGSYKSGRNVIPGGVIPQLTLNALTAAAVYLISVQYKIKTRIDLPELDLSSIFGKGHSDTKISDEGSEAGDVAAVENREWPGGPRDFAGWDGDV
jgi:hypothetical protein